MDTDVTDLPIYKRAVDFRFKCGSTNWRGVWKLNLFRKFKSY